MNQGIPRPLLIVLVLLGGIGFFFLAQPPHSICNSQLEVLKETQKGAIFPSLNKNIQKPALYSRLVDNCKMGNSPGACYELFSVLKKLIRDLNGTQVECLQPFGEVEEVKKALREGLRLMVQLAWGDKPPEKGMEKFGWFEASDIALFCNLKELFVKIYGSEEWESYRSSTYAKLPGEAQIINDGVCENCDKIKKAADVMPAEEVWVRSLFSVRCEQYR